MFRYISRRKALAELSLLAAAPAAISGCALTNEKNAPLENDYGFLHGVASGDPDHSSVIIWSRISGVIGRASVDWEVSKTSDFRQLVAVGKQPTDEQRDHTVKVLVGGLDVGETYYYRFKSGNSVSMVGRTHTLPEGHVDKLGIAVVSCSNYPFGFFNAYDAIAKDTGIDLVLHLGDYIYEYAEDSWGGDVGEQLDRLHKPANEIVSLSDYRQRHAQYKTDMGSRAMHAAHPLIAIWDDHESANNPWVNGAENHQPEEEGDWQQRRSASLQAYYEWMPIREPGMGESRAEYWRHFSFGNLASLTTLETRHTGRSLQVDYADYIADIDSREKRDAFMRDVLGDTSRAMLSEKMEDFLARSLKDSVSAGQTWRLIGNQIPMARTHVPPMNHPFFKQMGSDPNDPVAEEWMAVVKQGEFDLPIYLDTWDGYQNSREAFYDLCSSAGASDLLVLTGDSHAFWQNQLFDQNGKAMGLELGTAGVSSPGDFLRFGEEGAKILDNMVSDHNHEVVWTENRFNGYIRLVLSHTRADAEFIGVSTVLTPEYSTNLIRHCKIEKDKGSLLYREA